MYFLEARRLYRKCRAERKETDLLEKYPGFVEKETPAAASADAGATPPLDVNYLMKSSFAISAEIERNSLLEKIMEVVMESSEAQDGYLLLEDNGRLIVSAENHVMKKPSMALASNFEDAGDICKAIVRYVYRTAERVALNNACREDVFKDSPEVKAMQLRSVLCLPVKKQARMIGVLYLENRLSDGVFTPKKAHMTELLTAQAAISLENVRLLDEMKKAEEAQRESDIRFRSLIQNSSDIIRILDREGRIIYNSPSTRNILGYPDDYLLGKSPMDFIHPEDLERVRIDLGEVFDRSNPGMVTEFRIRKADGKYLDVESIGVNMIGVPGVDGIVVTTRPITERKQAERERERLLAQLKDKTSELQDANEELEVKSEELAAQAEEIECTNEELRKNYDELQKVTVSLRETHNYLESLFNYANAPIIVWDPKFTITRFNRAFEYLSGYTANEVIGKNLSILFPPNSREESLDKIRRTLEGEQWESVEIPIEHKYGSVRIALWNSANIYDAQKILLATIAQGQDISARKQAEKDLEEEKAQAELYLDLMGHDISNMHQIALMQLEIAGEIMSTSGKLETDDKELIETPFKTLERAARLIDNVRKLQKHKSGEYKMETVDLSKVLEDVLKEYSAIPGRNVRINFAPNGACLVRANPLLKDVFSNLVGNAVKHCGDPVEISAGVHKSSLNGNLFYRVAIEDNGSGIPDDKKDEVFQRFKRGQTKAKGTGLGLYLVKSLVEGFGGYVEVQNRVLVDYTKGTRFLVYLPGIKEEKNAG